MTKGQELYDHIVKELTEAGQTRIVHEVIINHLLTMSDDELLSAIGKLKDDLPTERERCYHCDNNKFFLIYFMNRLHSVCTNCNKRNLEIQDYFPDEADKEE